MGFKIRCICYRDFIRRFGAAVRFSLHGRAFEGQRRFENLRGLNAALQFFRLADGLRLRLLDLSETSVLAVQELTPMLPRMIRATEDFLIAGQLSNATEDSQTTVTGFAEVPKNSSNNDNMKSGF